MVVQPVRSRRGRSLGVRARVTAVRRLSPHLVRVTFGGPQLHGITSGGYDQRCKLLLPLPGQDEPLVPDGPEWFSAYRALPQEVRPIVRTYTIRAHRPHLGEVDVEFALHGDLGPASRWARRAEPGQVLGLVAPDSADPGSAGVRYRPGAAGEQLLVADDSALPALSSILEALPTGVEAQVVLHVPDAADVPEFDLGDGVRLTWLTGDESLVDVVRGLPRRGPDCYAWVAGESAAVHRIRRHLVDELGFGGSAYFGGYWRAGRAEGES